MRRFFTGIILLWVGLLLPLTLLITWQRQDAPVNQLLYVSASINLVTYYQVRLDTLERHEISPRLLATRRHLYIPPGEDNLSPDSTSTIGIMPTSHQQSDIMIRYENGDPPFVIETSGQAYAPVWSPDGGWIAFHMVDYDYGWTADLYRVQVGTATPERLTDTADYTEEMPRWSPDGEWLAFVHRSIWGDPHIYKIRPDGTDLQQISQTPATLPAWSPDSQWIAYSGYRGSGEIFLADVAGTSEEKLTDVRGYDTDPMWSPDGQWIAFLSALGADTDLYAIRLADRKLITVSATSNLESKPQWIIPPDLPWQPLYLLVVGVLLPFLFKVYKAH